MREYLLALSRARTAARIDERDYDAQYRWLLERIDPGSSLERRFLDFLHTSRLRLPTLAQHRPDPAIAAQVDFFYERDRMPGICVFIDGPAHDAAIRAAQDDAVRRLLEDRGYHVIAITSSAELATQVAALPEVFAPELR